MKRGLTTGGLIKTKTESANVPFSGIDRGEGNYSGDSDDGNGDGNSDSDSVGSSNGNGEGGGAENGYSNSD